MNTAAFPTSTTRWRDPKKALWLVSPAIPLVGLIGPLLGGVTGGAGWFWALPVLFYGIFPILDVWIGEDSANPPDTAVAGLEKDRYYRFIVAAYIPLQFLTTVFCTWLVVQGGLTWVAALGALFSCAIVNGVGINTAHELGHKTNGMERWLAKLTLAPVAYGHFFIEHNKGHHKNVATLDDPASSRMGESFWAFLPRTVFGSLRSAWHIERERLARKGLSVWSPQNENLQAWAMTVALYGALTLWLGPWALLFLVAQAIWGFSLLEVVNYIEHYGLLREKLPNGRYERCAPRHSWNSNHVVTNLALYQLQRHSDHHANPTRRYQALRHFDESPQLPSGYASMLILAYVPPLWFRVMDRRVAAHFGGEIERAHLHGPKRETLLRRWGRTAVAGAKPAMDAPSLTTPSVESPAAVTRHQCPNCDYLYDESVGCPHEGFAAGTRWADLPMGWVCPQCFVREKPDFHVVDGPLVSA
jgi:alkane 1-monooxygenase